MLNTKHTVEFVKTKIIANIQTYFNRMVRKSVKLKKKELHKVNR